MDLSIILSPLLGVLWYLIPILIVITLLKSSWFKGILGEFIVNILAKIMLDKNEYHLIKNVTLPTPDGTTQIDHVIVSKYGVFVIETKNMKGWIFGSSNQKVWTQKIFKHSSKFQNPLHQNYKHVKILEELLNLNNNQVHSLVVFIGEATFKTEMPENVTSGGGYIRFIKARKNPILSDTEVNKIIQQIESGRLARSFKTNREHVKHVKNIVAEKKKEIYCPKCGSSMVLRETKKGENKGKKFGVVVASQNVEASSVSHNKSIERDIASLCPSCRSLIKSAVNPIVQFPSIQYLPPNNHHSCPLRDILKRHTKDI